MQNFSTNETQGNFDELKAEVRRGIDDLEAGRVRVFDSPEALSAFFDELKATIRTKAKRAGRPVE